MFRGLIEKLDMFFPGLSDAEGNLEFLSATSHLSLPTTKKNNASVGTGLMSQFD